MYIEHTVPGGGNKPQIVSRVLFVNDISFLVETLLPELIKLGIEVELVGRTSEAPSTDRPTFAEQSVSSFVAILRARPHDIIHVNYGLFGFLAVPDTRSAAIIHIHGSEIRPGKAWKIRAANFVSVVFSKMADRIWYSTPDLRVHLENAGINSTFMPNPIPRQFFEIPDPQLPENRVLFAIPLSLEKGADMAIGAARILLERLPEVKVTALGWGPYPDEALALRTQIPDSIELLPWVDRQGFARIISNSTVVVGQMRLGILSNIELEAMALGRPVIARVREDLYRKEPHYDTPPPLLNAFGPEEVADHVEAVIADPTSKRSLGTRARDWVLRHHGVERVARLYRDAYEDLSRPNGG
jgi:glycosyltransferase involved in cell wall biosynthesis